MLGSVGSEDNYKGLDEGFSKAATAQRKKKKSKKNTINSRRFSEEQIRSLESLFKMENKLEPRKKLEMARDLGLHPRQVAIWFQNRRARWKSKQVEQDYTSLKADYDRLSHRFESLKKEKHALLQQLRDLCSRLKEGSKDLDMSSGSENGDTNLDRLNSGPLMHDKEGVKKNVHEFSEEAQHEKACNFDLGSLFFDQSCSCSNWWDVWSSNS